MPFPTTGTLDTFAGANEDPITGNWNNRINAAHDPLARESNALTSGVGGSGSAWWNPTPFGPNCEVWVTLTNLPDENHNIRLCARIGNPGTSSPIGYYLRLSRETGVTDEVGIFLMDDTLIGAFVSQEFAAGDQFGFELNGTTLKGYRKPSGGSWTELLSRTDSTYDAGGNIGVMIAEGATPIILDDFGGGTVVTGDTTVKMRSQFLDYDYSR